MTAAGWDGMSHRTSLSKKCPHVKEERERQRSKFSVVGGVFTKNNLFVEKEKEII